MKQKPTPKAMVLRYHYTKTFVHDLKAITEHKEYGQWWSDMTNTDRAYVLKGVRR